MCGRAGGRQEPHIWKNRDDVALYAPEVAPAEPDLSRRCTFQTGGTGYRRPLSLTRRVVAVAFPEVLGDHFTELVVNLGKIAESGKSLQIMGPSPFLRMQELVERDE